MNDCGVTNISPGQEIPLQGCSSPDVIKRIILCPSSFLGAFFFLQVASQLNYCFSLGITLQRVNKSDLSLVSK